MSKYYPCFQVCPLKFIIHIFPLLISPNENLMLYDLLFKVLGVQRSVEPKWERIPSEG